MAITIGRKDLATSADAFPVTPNDSADLAVTARALLVATAGTLQVTTVNGHTRALTVPSGVVPIQVTRVWSTNTTASGITALV